MLTPTLPQEANSYIEGLKVDTFHDPYQFEWARGTPPSPVAHPPWPIGRKEGRDVSS